jgi:hypothetical protein
MPVFIKDVRNELKSGADKVKTHTPPSYISRNVLKYPKLKVTKLTQAGDLSAKTLTFSCIVASENPKRKGSRPNYKVTIKFHNMIYKEVETPQFNTRLLVSQRKKSKKFVRWHKKPSVKLNPVSLKCQCEDFRHRFEHQLKSEKALIGGPRKYTRKTKPWEQGGYPYANETDKLGYCKHIQSLFHVLKREKKIREV